MNNSMDKKIISKSRLKNQYLSFGDWSEWPKSIE